MRSNKWKALSLETRENSTNILNVFMDFEVPEMTMVTSFSRLGAMDSWLALLPATARGRPHQPDRRAASSSTPTVSRGTSMSLMSSSSLRCRPCTCGCVSDEVVCIHDVLGEPAQAARRLGIEIQKLRFQRTLKNSPDQPRMQLISYSYFRTTMNHEPGRCGLSSVI